MEFVTGSSFVRGCEKGWGRGKCERHARCEIHGLIIISTEERMKETCVAYRAGSVGCIHVGSANHHGSSHSEFF